MAPLRSSRSSRHLQTDSGPQGRIRGGVVDHDPMEGLPVRRWEMIDVTIKQDAKDQENDEDGKKGNNPNWPWPDLPMPKDFHLLPAHSQELLRRARAPNKNPNIAVFNRETGEYERPNLNPNNPAAMTPVTRASNLNESTNLRSPDPVQFGQDVDRDEADPDDNIDTDKPSHEQSKDRTITLKRWVPLPQSIADKKPEPKYLADRRPGLPPLYGHRSATNPSTSTTTGYEPNISSTLMNTNPAMNTGDVVVGSVNVSAGSGAIPSGYRVLADGTTLPMGPGIGPAAAPSAAQMPGEVARRRQPPPPPKRRKKGGPGRSRRKVEAPGLAVNGSGLTKAVVATTVGEEAGATGVSTGDADGLGEREGATTQPTTKAIKGARNQEQQSRRGDESIAAGNDLEMAEPGPGPGSEPELEPEGDGESNSSGSSSGSGSGSGSEDQGSEEGEIDESGEPADPPATAALAPDLSIQPPSPDLLGNLESEIQGMERGGPTF